jgi:RNA-directed DNA polymerase
MVAKLYLEPLVEPLFHNDSYGYRPGKSALDAVGQARQRCWRNDWVLDLDIKGFFDNIDHSLMMHAVRKHTDSSWMLLYIERWLKVSGIDSEGHEVRRDRGTPQGGVASPLLANIFLHHVFDQWMAEQFPHIPFERYADDIVVHCKSKAQTLFIRQKIEERLRLCKLAAHPEKTKIVYCKDEDRRGNHKHESFDFLGYTYRPRCALYLRCSENNNWVRQPAQSRKVRGTFSNHKPLPLIDLRQCVRMETQDNGIKNSIQLHAVSVFRFSFSILSKPKGNQVNETRNGTF